MVYVCNDEIYFDQYEDSFKDFLILEQRKISISEIGVFCEIFDIYEMY